MNTTSMYTRAVLSLIGCLRFHHVYVAGQIFCSHLLCSSSYLAVLKSTKLAGSNKLLSLAQISVALPCIALICFAQLKSTQPCKALFAQLELNLLILSELLMAEHSLLDGTVLMWLGCYEHLCVVHKSQSPRWWAQLGCQIGTNLCCFFCGGERLFRSQCACLLLFTNLLPGDLVAAVKRLS